MNNITISIETLVNDIADQISNGWRCVGNLQNLSYYQTCEDDIYNEEYELEKIRFESNIARLHISFCALLEALQMPCLLNQYQTDFERLKGKLYELNTLPYVGELNNDTLGLFWMYHKSISSLIGHNIKDTLEIDRRMQLERILSNTPKIVKDRNVVPSNESEVRRCVYELLIHIFPDTVREIPISQVTKTYKPDLGVKSLKTAVEYKFADSVDEVRKAVGGLYEDMRGYSGSEDWKYFYAIIYMTDAYYTIEQIKSEFQHTDADDNWKPILVIGKGARNR